MRLFDPSIYIWYLIMSRILYLVSAWAYGIRRYAYPANFIV
jgi:hypothetical protein